MKPYRVVSVALLVLILVSALAPMIPAQAQSLFDGIIAYIGTDGNVYVMRDNGSTQQITHDAIITDTDSEYITDKVWYDCVYLFGDKQHLFFTRRSTVYGVPPDYVFYNLVSNTVMLDTPAQDTIYFEDTDETFSNAPICESPGLDENGFYFTVSKDEYLESNEIHREYNQYLSGAQKPVFEFTTKHTLRFGYRRGKIATYQENPYEVIFYDFTNLEFSRFNIPMEKYFGSTWLSDNEIVLTGQNSAEIVTINLQTKRVEPWEFAIQNAVVTNTTSLGYYLITGNNGKETPTSLYKVDLNRQSSELLYSPSSPVGIWIRTSPDRGTISIIEESADYIGLNKLLLLQSKGNPTTVSSSVDFYYAWSRNSQTIYFIQMTQPSPDDYMLTRELMAYDVRTGSSTKILDILPWDMSSEVGVVEPIDWLLNDSASSETESSTTPPDNNSNSTDQTNPQNQPSIFEPFVNSNYTPILVFSGIGVVALLGVGAGVVWWTARPKPKPSAPARQENQIPSSPVSPQLQRAVRLAKEKQFKESFEILRELVKSEGNNPEIWYYLGYDLVNMGDFANAEKCFSRAKQYGHPKADRALDWIKNNHRR
ncbi:MAG: hypothetical protein HFACDABA_00992 [Anaerolineales bacterium]|nr:hypothetical protein [Anaerolineales bacterium]